MQRAFDHKHIKPTLILLVALFGTSTIYYRQNLAWIDTASRQFVAFPDPQYPDDSVILEPDGITTGIPVVPHNYRSDGVLEVSSSASHPIHDLIAQAENKWHSKQNIASRNIQQAFYEYRRRYGRFPPKGFDKWWEYVEQHNVQLPDDYDQIWHDIEPFWGLDPADLQRVQSEQEGHSESYTIGKGVGEPIKIVNQSLSKPELMRASEGILSLLKPIEEHLPPFRAVMSPLDNPYAFFDYDVKQAALRAARSKKRLKMQDLPPTTVRGWLSACPEHRSHPAAPSKSGFTGRTFIHDHRKTMDPCFHPKILETHSQFLAFGDFPPTPDRPMIPQFSFCSSTLHYDIRIPSLLSWVQDIHPQEHNPEWDRRSDERLSWRGSNTGMWQTAENRWKESQRPRAVKFASDTEGEVKVLFPPTKRDDPVGEGRNVSRSKINPAFFDVAFAGSPLQCPEDYCKEIEYMFDWRKFQDARGAANFKYVLDVDGNAWSSRFQRLMVSNALVFKASIYPEWFLDRIQPWVHYVPVQVDLSDLHDTLAFFRGDLYGEGSHHELARKMVENSRQWAQKFWRKEDMTAYAFRLMLEYARVMSLDRESMSFSI
ncbi:glycosyltransferase family 90 protein [Macrolepiota fuliginosa MF-IS2]|uniref:Glycosyltransferase family 90 protein n=1 Tax=Macrolepiota fuliginosa MF-IS2 TaxID=1400762 RepID=A0A9P5XH32_9AGAR|nr:glycosyltransferase family 90 protein [Macrolepiota fuliginosa MF-IS2]